MARTFNAAALDTGQSRLDTAFVALGWGAVIGAFAIWLWLLPRYAVDVPIMDQWDTPALQIISGRRRATLPEPVMQRKDPGLNQRLDRPDAERLAKVAGDRIGHGGGHAHMERAIGGGFTRQPPRAVTQRRPLDQILNQGRANAGRTIEGGAGPAGTPLRAKSS